MNDKWMQGGCYIINSPSSTAFLWEREKSCSLSVLASGSFKKVTFKIEIDESVSVLELKLHSLPDAWYLKLLFYL